MNARAIVIAASVASLASIAAAVLGAAIGTTSLAACSGDERAHVFSGRLYEVDRGCLDTVSSLDVVDGPLPTTPCAPICFVAAPDEDSGFRQVYVSTMCAPFPPAFDGTGVDPRCAPALDAYTRNTTCLDDGGISNLPDAGDAGDAHP